MERDREDQQDTASPVRRNPLRLRGRLEEVQVRKRPISHSQEGASRQEPDQCRHPLDHLHLLRQHNRRCQQRPEARRNHDAGGEPQGGVEQSAAHVGGEEHDRCTYRRHAPREQGGDQSLDDRVFGDEPIR